MFQRKDRINKHQMKNFYVEKVIMDIPAIDYDSKYHAFYHRWIMKQYCNNTNYDPKIFQDGFEYTFQVPDTFNWRDLDTVPHMRRYDTIRKINIDGDTYIRYAVCICCNFSFELDIAFTSRVPNGEMSR